MTHTPTRATRPAEPRSAGSVAGGRAGARPVDALQNRQAAVDVLGSWPEGVDLPRYSPWRHVPEWEPHGLWLRDRPQIEWPDAVFSVTRAPWLLRLLLVISLVLGQATMGKGLGLSSLSAHLVAAGLTILLWGWIEWWQTWDLTSIGRRLGALGVQAVLTAMIIVICPLGALVVWANYMICGTFFTGAWLLASLTGTSVLITAVQVGGFDRIPSNLTLSLGLFLLDLAIGLVSITLANRREEAVLRRNEITRRLLIEQKKNEQLHDQLVERSREAGMLSERARLARDLHDTVAQGLVAVVTQLEAIADDAFTDPSDRRRVDNAKALAREGLGEARRAVSALRSTALDGAALPQAVRRMLDEWSQVNAVAGTLNVSGEPRPIGADPELIRVVQEALSNVARHAHARQVAISVDYLDDQVLIDIHDDGTGFEPTCTEGPTASGGHGLPGMAERLRLAGGTFAIESDPGRGCVVSAVVPG